MGRAKKGATTSPATTPTRKTSPQTLIRRLLLLTRGLSIEAGWTVEKAAATLANQIEFACDLDEYYPVNKDDEDDARPDLVSSVLAEIGFVWERNDGVRDPSEAKWNTEGLTHAVWLQHVDSLKELAQELLRDKHGNTPAQRGVRFADEPSGGAGTRGSKRGRDEVDLSEAETEKNKDSSEEVVNPLEKLTPAELAANEKLMAAARAAMEGVPTESGKGGASGNGRVELELHVLPPPVSYDLPQTRSCASGLFFEEGASGVPELKKRKKMSFDRWSEYNNHLCDLIVDVTARKAYRSYVALLVRFYVTTGGSKWNILLDLDEEIREMVKSQELDGFDDRRIMERFLSRPELLTKGSKGGGGRDGGRTKGGKDKSQIPCRFFKTPAGCKKGDNCDHKH